jgi:hypothetical protein
MKPKRFKKDTGMKLDYQETQLPNKVRVLTARMPQVQSVACGIWVGVGGRYESKRNPAPAISLSTCCSRARRNARRAPSRRPSKGGAAISTPSPRRRPPATTRASASKNAWKALDILADMFVNPRFAPADIDKERGVIIEEIMMYRDQPHQLVQDFLGELIWTNHPVGRPADRHPGKHRAHDARRDSGVQGRRNTRAATRAWPSRARWTTTNACAWWRPPAGSAGARGAAVQEGGYVQNRPALYVHGRTSSNRIWRWASDSSAGTIHADMSSNS